VRPKPHHFTAKDFVVKGREEELYRAIFLGAGKTFQDLPYMPELKTSLSRRQVLGVV
jgi:hypothetical protein